MKITLAHIILLAATVSAAPVAEPNAGLAAREALPPVRKLSYCYNDGTCWPEDYLKVKREADVEPEPTPVPEPTTVHDSTVAGLPKHSGIFALPIRKISYCYADGRCWPGDYKKRSAEPEVNPGRPTEPECLGGPDCPPSWSEKRSAEAMPQDDTDLPPTNDDTAEPETSPAPVAPGPKVKVPIRVMSYCYADGKCFPRDWLKRSAEPIGTFQVDF